MSAPKWAVGMRRLGLGLYERDGVLHLDSAAICRAARVPYTERNARLVEQEAVSVIRQLYGSEIEVEVVEARSC